MSLTRRLFARATMGVPLALKGTIHASGGPMGLAGPVFGGGAMSANDTAKQVFQQKVWHKIRLDTRPDEDENGIRWMRRQAMGGLDPDLSVLNSMSVVRRIQLQIDRDKANNARSRSLRHRIIRAMGGNPEDFE